MALFSVFTKVKNLIAPRALSSTPPPASTPTQPPLGQRSSEASRTRQKASFDTHKVKTGRVSKSKQTDNQGKRRSGFSDLRKPIQQVDSPQSDHDPDGDTLVKDGDSVITTTIYDNSLVKIDFEEYIPASDRFIRYYDPKYKEWASEEIWLFNKLSKRGEEPLLRAKWQQDFLSFPDNLFSSNEKLIHINNFDTVISEGQSYCASIPNIRNEAKSIIHSHQ